jgi:hypothetical protein
VAPVAANAPAAHRLCHLFISLRGARSGIPSPVPRSVHPLNPLLPQSRSSSWFLALPLDCASRAGGAA